MPRFRKDHLSEAYTHADGAIGHFTIGRSGKGDINLNADGKRILTFDEYLRLVDNSAAHLKPIVTTAYYTGMRKGELLKLKWSHIDRKAGFIRLPAEIVKERRDKNIPINEHVKEILDSVLRSISHGFVFTYQGNYIEENGIKKSFKTACKNAGIPHGTKTKNGLIFHDIRRTVKTNMVEAGVDKAHRDLILGHSLKGMDVYYIAPTEKTLAEAMNKFTKWVDGQLDSANVDHSVDQEPNNQEGVTTNH